MQKNTPIINATICLILTFAAMTANAAQFDIPGPPGSGDFGTSVTILQNGNIVVTDPTYDAPGPIADVGAVYLYDGLSLALISTLTGSNANDRVGNGNVTLLATGNFVVRSPDWNGTRGAVTFVNGTTGLNATVSSANSLVGTTVGDGIGAGGSAPAILALTTGGYAVASPNWDDFSTGVANVGAVTWGNGVTGISGAVSGANSLIGSSPNDFVGSEGVAPVKDGNFIVGSSSWDNTSPSVADVGAVTWINGTAGLTGPVSSANSYVGKTAGDFIGRNGIVVLANGNYVIRSLLADHPTTGVTDVGGAIWGNGATGTVGVLSATTALLGTRSNDFLPNGTFLITPLTNGNYVVTGSNIDDPVTGTVDVGAAILCNGVTGTSGQITSANSLMGTAASQNVGAGARALENGNFVILSPGWDDGATANVGAVTWGNGTTGITGSISGANSLIGSTAGDEVGGLLVVLRNGNYVVGSRLWDNPSTLVANVGAVTWGNGATGTTGVVSGANSLIGTSAGDEVGRFLVALQNGNFVAVNFNWDNPSPLVQNVGAVTLGNGNGGTVGSVSGANSLIGSSANDLVGGAGVTVLTNGNYVVNSPGWDTGATTDAGASTWCNGTSGCTGVVSAANSMIGSSANDQIGRVFGAIRNGNYMTGSNTWDNGALSDAGAVAVVDGTTGAVGTFSPTNSLVGASAGDEIGGRIALPLLNGNFYQLSGSLFDPWVVTFISGFGGTVGSPTNGLTGGNSFFYTVARDVTQVAVDNGRNRLIAGRGGTNTLSILSFSTTAIADGDINNPANWSNGVPNGTLTGLIPSGRSMSISSVMEVGLVYVRCGANLSGGSNTAYVLGSVRKDFCGAANESFNFPVGDASNYTPVSVANTNGTGSLTISVGDGFLGSSFPNSLIGSAYSLSRYWSIIGFGVTADFTFNYVDADVNGVESELRAFRQPTGVFGVDGPQSLPAMYAPSFVDTVNNRFTALNVSQFSDWTASKPLLVPTAAGVAVSGRVVTNDGRGLRNATVTLTDASGASRNVRTSSFGYFRFDDVAAGQVVTVEVRSKRFSFAPQVVFVGDEITGLDFTAVGRE